LVCTGSQNINACGVLCKTPIGIEDMVCIIVDPMLATGNSIRYTIDLLRQHGVSQIKVLSIIAAPEGIDNVLSCATLSFTLPQRTRD